MPLTDKEQLQEELAELRRLAQSPAWDLYSSHLRQLVIRAEEEKALHLRKNDTHRAILIQGQVDGMKRALDALDKMISSVNLNKDESIPSY